MSTRINSTALARNAPASTGPPVADDCSGGMDSYGVVVVYAYLYVGSLIDTQARRNSCSKTRRPRSTRKSRKLRN